MDVQRHLLDQLANHRLRNPRYSLRALARDLHIDPSYLSKLIRGKRKVESFRPRSSYQTLEVDSFRLIAEWHHYAIFELLKIPGAPWDAKRVAEWLPISKPIAEDALGRLERLHLVRRSETGYVASQAGITTTGNPFSAMPFRFLQSQLLTLARESLEKVPMTDRDQTSMTMAIARSELPRAKRMLTRFRRRFCSDLQGSAAPKDDVYTLSLSFFPMTVTQEKPQRSRAL